MGGCQVAVQQVTITVVYVILLPVQVAVINNCKHQQHQLQQQHQQHWQQATQQQQARAAIQTVTSHSKIVTLNQTPVSKLKQMLISL